MEIINKKDVLVNYLKLCGKHDMVNAVIKYCDEDHGIVFNKHPARNEKKFGTIYDYGVSSKFRGCENIEKLQNSNVFHKEKNISNNLNDIVLKNSKCVDDIPRVKCYGKEEISLEGLEEKTIEKTVKSYYNRKKTKTNLLNKQDNAISEILDDICEVIAPEGKGKFLKFIGENYVYILLENGTYHCYPLHLLKLNRSFLKNNSMFTLKFDYKDMALKHARNLIKSKNKKIYKRPNLITEDNMFHDNFVDFPKEFDYLKDYIIKNDNKYLTSCLKENMVHSVLDHGKCSYNKEILDCLQNCNDVIKQNVKIKTLNNIYKLENSKNIYISK
ncbi:conserved Plasmodium protein, unknown function [Plasmodium sp. DRC-Itaito]|nr:conserved Plasmodium protein, unknown function [Plasmodium sp. DRC-Itaito]